jgi:hypothetical protein
VAGRVRAPPLQREPGTMQPVLPTCVICNLDLSEPIGRLPGLSARTPPPTLERVSRAASWAADEHLLYVLCASLWSASRRTGSRRREAADHILLCCIVANLVPHVLKNFIDQERPDRCMVHLHRRGIPRSGKPYDAFPSGHAMHVGALASAVSWLYPKWSGVAWAIAGTLASTRIIVLAHWASDVAIGLVSGVLIERLLRPLTRMRLGGARQDSLTMADIANRGLD